MSIIILGHSGFIGKEVERELTGRGLSVIGKSYPELDLTKIEHANSLKDHLNPSTTIVMCSGLKRNHGDNLDTFDKNNSMVTNLCRVIEQSPIKRLVYLSSAAVYGEDIENWQITENTPVHPNTYYGISKFGSERVLRKAADKTGMSLLILRPAAIYGPNEGMDTYSPSGFVRSMLRNQPITLWGDGKELREFIFIDDLARIISHLTTGDYQGVLNIATGKSHTFDESIRIASKYGKLDTKSRERTKDKVNHGFDISNLKAAVPNLEFTSLEDGIRITYERESR